MVKQAKTAFFGRRPRGVKVADRRNRTRDLSLRKRRTSHCTMGPPLFFYLSATNIIKITQLTLRSLHGYWLTMLLHTETSWSSTTTLSPVLWLRFCECCTRRSLSTPGWRGDVHPPISESLVLRKLLRLRPSKATADSLFCNRFLQKCAPFLASSITFLFNLSLSTSSFPSAWKHAKVIPLYKHRGSQSDPSNYRPISLLPAIGKVMDDIQSSRLLDSWHPTS